MRDETGKRAMMRAGAESVWSGCAGYCGGAVSVWRCGVLYGHAGISVKKQRKRLLICNSLKVAKTG